MILLLLLAISGVQPSSDLTASIMAGGIDHAVASNAQSQNAGSGEDRAISPDGRTVAFVKVEAGSPDTDARTSVWIADRATGRTRRLLAHGPSPEPTRNLTGFEHPRFSLDGGFLYVNSDAWATSPAVHQVRLSTGKERFVIDGGLIGVLRNGPYRGYLLVGRHRYRTPSGSGSTNPVYVVRPDAQRIFMVPGSDKDDGEASLAAWLRTKGWFAN